jgi:hypothetical protein
LEVLSATTPACACGEITTSGFVSACQQRAGIGIDRFRRDLNCPYAEPPPELDGLANHLLIVVATYTNGPDAHSKTNALDAVRALGHQVTQQQNQISWAVAAGAKALSSKKRKKEGEEKEAP